MQIPINLTYQYSPAPLTKCTNYFTVDNHCGDKTPCPWKGKNFSCCLIFKGHL